MEFLQRASIPSLKMSVRPVFRSVYFAGLFLLVTIASCDSSVSSVTDPAQNQDPETEENPVESVMTAAIEGVNGRPVLRRRPTLESTGMYFSVYAVCPQREMP